MEQRLYEALQSNPIIAAVRDDEGLEACLQADVQTVFVLYGDICGIAGIVRRIKDAGKIAIVHADLITALPPRRSPSIFCTAPRWPTGSSRPAPT